MLLLLAVGVAAPTLAAGAPEPADAPRPLLVTRARLWTAGGVLPDREILIRDGRVVAVGGVGSLACPPDTRVIDAAGDTLLPGLIDAHVHLSFAARLPPELAANPRENAYAIAGQQLLRSGVTTGRIHLWDLPSGAAFKRAAASDRFPAPRFQLGGPGFMGGHPEWDSPTGNVWGVKSVEDAVQKVQRIKDAGGDWVALHHLRKFQPGELEAIVAAARRLGLRIMIAGDRIADLERAVDLDPDSVEYLDFSATPLYPNELLARLKAHRPQPTLVPMPGNRRRFLAYRRGEMSLDDPRLVEFMPPTAAEFARTALREDRTLETSFTREFDAAFPTLSAKFQQLRATGLPVAIGTDCGSPAHFHADAIWWEMETWRQFGVAPDDILRAATVIPAALLRDPDIGHLRAGARGDFVLYRGRFDDHPLSVARVRTVAKGGVLFVNDGAWIESTPQPTPSSRVSSTSDSHASRP